MYNVGGPGYTYRLNPNSFVIQMKGRGCSQEEISLCMQKKYTELPFEAIQRFFRNLNLSQEELYKRYDHHFVSFCVNIVRGPFVAESQKTANVFRALLVTHFSQLPEVISVNPMVPIPFEIRALYT